MIKPEQNSTARAARVITIAALISIFIYSFIVSLPSILINDVIDTFSLEGTDEGLMGALTSLGFLFSLFFTILIQGRAKKSTVLLAALASQAIMLVLCGFSPTFFLFCIGCTLVGFSGGFIDTFTNSIIVDVRKHDSAKYLGYLHGLFGIGSLMSPLVFFLVLRHIDWRGVHYLLAVASVFVILLILLLARGAGGKDDSAVKREQFFTKADLFAYIKIKRNAAISCAGFFSMVLIACTMLWIVRYMTLRYDAAEMGAVSITVYWVCATINRIFFPYFTKRAPMKFFTLGSVLSGVFLLIGIFSGSAVVLCVMMGAFGFCSGHFVPVLVRECAVGYEGKTTFTTSFIMFILCIGRIVSPLMMAFTTAHISLDVSMIIPVAAALLAAGFGWMALKGGAPYEKDPDHPAG